jgi:hypothetical protein
MEMVNDPFLSPLLLQMAVFSAIDATERILGAGSVAMRGRVEFQGSREPVRLDNVFTGDFNVAMQASLGAALPLAWALQTGFDELRLRNISLTMEVHDEKRHFQIEQAWASRNVVRPGDTLDVNVVLSGPNGAEKAGKVSYTVPIGATPGPLYFTIADGNTTNLSEFRHLVGTTPRSAGQVVSLLNQLRGNDKAYVRVWRAEPGYQIQGEDYPSPPASLSLILAKAQATPGVTALAHSSKLAELEISAGNVTVAGARTVQVEIKE